MINNEQVLYKGDWEFELEQNLLEKRRELIIMLEEEHTEVKILSPPPSELPTPRWSETGPDPVCKWLELAQEWSNSSCSNPVQEFFKHFDCV